VYKKPPRINCVKMVRKIRALPQPTKDRCANSDRPHVVEAYLKAWIQWVLAHDISMWWEKWEEAHEDYEDHRKEKKEALKAKGSKKEELQEAV
jgi:hypothetical protein